ncbi:MAG: N-acetyltransferase family protein [Leptothrix sp. (in: b-proteobacteria)]
MSDLPLPELPTYRLRHGQEGDAEAIAQILNHYIEHSTATFMTEPVSVHSRRDFILERKAEHPIWIAELDGEAVGWAALSPHQPRSAYAHTVENSIYLHPAHLRRGLGVKLLTRVVEDAQRNGFHSLIAGACSEQAGSLALHQRLGYQPCAHFHEVARKFDRWLDVIYLERALRPSGHVPG